MGRVFNILLCKCVFVLLISFPLIALAKDVTIVPSIALRGEYDDNVTFVNTDEISDYLAIISPALTLDYASEVLKLEQVLNLITIIAVLILFFIILIGVVNTLRMTIRERTREIGTIRAIGMQKKDVRNVFILESFV